MQQNHISTIDCLETPRVQLPKSIENLLAFLSHRIISKCTNANCSLHPGVFQGIKSTGK
jgi:hypothetical protein